MSTTEQKMIDAINSGLNHSSNNVVVKVVDHGVDVLLHGNKICHFNKEQAILFDADFKTNVTKKRLNAILYGCLDSEYSIASHKGNWHLYKDGVIEQEWNGQATFSLKGQLINAT